MGILHHLNDDQATDLLRLARTAVKPGGGVVSLDGCYRDGQSSIAKSLLAGDRGEFVRSEEGYVRLTKGLLDHIGVHIGEDMLYVPYTLIILECTTTSR